MLICHCANTPKAGLMSKAIERTNKEVTFTVTNVLANLPISQQLS